MNKICQELIGFVEQRGRFTKSKARIKYKFIYQINLVRIYENTYEKAPSLLKKKKKKQEIRRVLGIREKALLRDNKTRIKF